MAAPAGEGVRRASVADIPALGRMLARAFAEDPVAVWSSPRPGPRPRMLERFHTARLRHLLPYGEVWTSAGGETAALWAPPDAWKTTLRQDLELTTCMLTPRLFWRGPLVGRGLFAVERQHPPHPPHWYLAVVGTDPAAQGRGLGTAVLEPVLSQCDRDGVAAYLESSSERNLDYYARFGFRTTKALQLPRGPRMWPMWRQPRS